ncbi:hypothetical protein LI187_14505 [bacterium 210820-DFI.6.38]|nr:hypothetical protein [bacterium 210820-DFI.6.38]
MRLTVSQIYYAFIMANVFCKGIGLDSSSVIYKVIMAVGLIGVLIGISTRKYSQKEIFISAVMLLSGILTLLITKQYTFLITCIAAIGIKKTDINRMMKTICSVRTVCFGLLFGLALLNIIDREQVEIWRKVGYISRYGMGYGHPNIFHLTLFIVLSLNYYFNNEKINKSKKILVIAFVLNIFVYRYSASRTGFLVISIFEFLIFVQKFEIAKKLLIKLPVAVYCMMMGFTYLTPALKKFGVLDITTLLNGRIGYTYLYLTKYGFSLFGFNNSLSETGLLLDNGYLRLLIETGIIGLLIWIYLNVKLMRKVIKNNDYKMAIVVTCFYIYIFTESFSSNIFMNYILFWGADEIFNKNKGVSINDNYLYTDLQ